MSQIFSTTRKITLGGASIPMKMSIFIASSGDVLQEAIGTFTDTGVEAILDPGERSKAERLLD